MSRSEFSEPECSICDDTGTVPGFDWHGPTDEPCECEINRRELRKLHAYQDRDDWDREPRWEP